MFLKLAFQNLGVSANSQQDISVAGFLEKKPVLSGIGLLHLKNERLLLAGVFYIYIGVI